MPATTLRPMTDDDLRLLAQWLAEPAVARWWAEDPQTAPERYTAELAEGIATYEIAMLDGVSVGMIQRYPIAAYGEYVDELTAAGVAVPDGAWSIDYLIGEPAARGRGVSSEMIRLAVEAVWREHPEAGCVVVPVHADNPASQRALLRAGFSRLPGEYELVPDNPADSSSHAVFRLDRPAAGRR